MFGTLVERFASNLSIRRLSRLPAVKTGRQAIEEYWTGNQDVIRGFPLAFVKKAAGEMMEAVLKVAVSPDPRMANRERLTNYVLGKAHWQVLVIDPYPADDPTGLRGQPGITGGLKAKLLEVAQKDKELKECLYGLGGDPLSLDDVEETVFFRYRVDHAWANIFDRLRDVYNDTNPATAKDWVRPYFAAMCGWEESLYREALRMPSAFDDTSNISPALKPLILSSFMNRVMSGARFPNFEWNECVTDIEKGDRRWRAGSWLSWD